MKIYEDASCASPYVKSGRVKYALKRVLNGYISCNDNGIGFWRRMDEVPFSVRAAIRNYENS